MRRKLPPYVPKTTDVAWQNNLFSIARDGAIWGWKSYPAIFKLDKANKKLIRMTPETLPVSDVAFMHALHRLDCVLGAMGWTLQPPVDWDGYDLPRENDNPGEN